MAKKFFRFKANNSESRDLNMISCAYFDLFGPFKPRPTKTQMIYWVKKFRDREKEEKK